MEAHRLMADRVIHVGMCLVKSGSRKVRRICCVTVGSSSNGEPDISGPEYSHGLPAGFGGSGSTIIGCERTGRRARTIELEPRYVDTAVVRWEEYTAQQATLSGDGRSFDETRAERQR
jgi:hypothetical protein